MKIHNIATFGIIAAIFGSTGQALATTIASQAYVDAKDNLKQDKLKAGTGGNVSVDDTSTTAASRAITGITATGNGNITFTTQPISVSAPAATTYVDDGTGSNTVLQLTSSGSKAPSVRAIQAAKQDKQTINSGQTIANVTQWTSSTTDGDKKFPTVQAVGQQFDKFANANNTVLSSGITSTKVGTYDTTATAVSNAITTNAIEAADDLLLKTDAFRDTVAYYNKDDNGFTDNLDAGSISPDDQVFAGNGTIASNMDAYVPTVAAVEARVQAAEGAIPGTTDTKSATYNSTNHTLTVATTGDGASTTKVATPKQVANTITDVKSYIDYKATTLDTTASATYNNGTLTVKTTDVDGNRTGKAATTSQVASTTSAIKSYVDYKATTLDTTASATYSNGALTVKTTDVDGNRTGKAATTSQVASTTSAVKSYVDYKASGALARKDAVGSSEITDKSVTYNFDMNNTALYDINTGAVPSGDYCTESIPCILTYYKKGGKVYTRWTPMDTESTAVNSSTTDAGATI